MKLADAKQLIASNLVLGEPAVVWVDGSRASLLLMQLANLVRKGCPALMFPYFWESKLKDIVLKLADELGSPVFSFEATKVYYDLEKSKTVAAVYMTDSSLFKVEAPYDGTMLVKLIDREDGVVPRYLWNRSLLPTNEGVGAVPNPIYPFTDWKLSDFISAFDFMNTPMVGNKYGEIISSAVGVSGVGSQASAG